MSELEKIENFKLQFFLLCFFLSYSYPFLFYPFSSIHTFYSQENKRMSIKSRNDRIAQIGHVNRALHSDPFK